MPRLTALDRLRARRDAFFTVNTRACGDGLFVGLRFGRGLGRGLRRWAGDTHAHEEKAKSLAQGVEQAHGFTSLESTVEFIAPSIFKRAAF